MRRLTIRDAPIVDRKLRADRPCKQTLDELVHAIQTLAGGGRLVQPAVTAALLKRLAEGTLKNHVSSIPLKPGARNRTCAVLRGLELGLSRRRAVTPEGGASNTARLACVSLVHLGMDSAATPLTKRATGNWQLAIGNWHVACPDRRLGSPAVH